MERVREIERHKHPTPARTAGMGHAAAAAILPQALPSLAAPLHPSSDRIVSEQSRDAGMAHTIGYMLAALATIEKTAHAGGEAENAGKNR
ncbi:MAG: hypothetical protein WBE88_01790 [Candidatus Acidiferrales bacterium]